MNDEKQFWVIVEHIDDMIKPVSYEVINAAKFLAKKCQGKVTALYLAADETPETKTLIQYGVDRVLVLLNKDLKQFKYTSYLDAVLPLVRREQPALLLLSATNHGNELASVLAAKLATGLATDCISLELEEDHILVTRPVYASSAHSTLLLVNKGPNIITLRPNFYHGSNFGSSPTGIIEKIKIDLPKKTFTFNVKKIIRESSGGIDLTEARIVVAGGMGMKKAENFRLIENLAHLLGGAVGASRPAVDAGWVKYSCQVGMSGRIISPDLYIACGISGTFQHLAGMSSCKCIVAINTDPRAPIFSLADIGIVEDALVALPLLINEVKESLS